MCACVNVKKKTCMHACMHACMHDQAWLKTMHVHMYAFFHNSLGLVFARLGQQLRVYICMFVYGHVCVHV